MKILAVQNIVVTEITPEAFSIDPRCAVGYNSVVQSVHSKTLFRMEGEKTVDRANETAVKSASDKENYTVMFVHIGATSKFSTRLAHFY